MATTRSAHSRATPALKQQTLGRQRKTVHRRDSPRRVERAQPALRSQIDYVRTPHRTTVEPITVSSDDEDYEEPRPKKKQKRGTKKRKSRAPDQSSLTQKWGQPTILKRLPSEIKDSEDEDEDDLYMLPDDPLFVKRPPSSGLLRRSSPGLGDDYATHDEGPHPTTADSEASAKRFKHVTFGSSSDVEEHSTRPSTANSKANISLATPVKPRKTEIPSSVTPESSASQVDIVERNDTRSPLKDRSVNIVASPSKAGSGDGFESEVENLPLKALKNDRDSPNTWNATLVITPRKDRGTRRKFERTTTIQDSEDEDDMELDSTPVAFQLTGFQSRKQSGQMNTPLSTILEASQEGCPGSQNVQQEESNFNAADWKLTGVVPDSEESNETAQVSLLPSNASTQSGSTFVTQDTELIVRPDQTQVVDSANVHVVHTDLQSTRSTPSHADSEAEVRISRPLNKSSPQEPVPTSSRRPGEESQSPRSTDLANLGSVNDYIQPVLPSASQLSDNPARHALDETDDEQDETDDEQDNNYEVEDADVNDEDYEDDYEGDSEYPQTYDPAAAALARDAARFGKTETQLQREESSIDEQEETVSSDLLPDEPGEEADRVPSSQPVEERVHLSPELQGNTTQAADSDNVDDLGPCSQLSAEVIETVPSSQPIERADALEQHRSPAASQRIENNAAGQSFSYEFIKPSLLHNRTQQGEHTQPPPLRPSQISTVCDTQSQANWPGSPYGFSVQATATPRKNASGWPETLPSSPAPRPPGLASQMSYGMETQGSLADLSLPLPPRQYSGDSEL